CSSNRMLCASRAESTIAGLYKPDLSLINAHERTGTSLRGTYCRGGPPGPPSVDTRIQKSTVSVWRTQFPTEGGHGGPPLQYASNGKVNKHVRHRRVNGSAWRSTNRCGSAAQDDERPCSSRAGFRRVLHRRKCRAWFPAIVDHRSRI